MGKDAISEDRRRWLEHLIAIEFPLREYHSNRTSVERWDELARWHERERLAWNRTHRDKIARWVRK